MPKLATKNIDRTFCAFFEELMNIENRVAWFLAGLCKAEKGVQKDMLNQRWTELVRGLFSASPRVPLESTCYH